MGQLGDADGDDGEREGEDRRMRGGQQRQDAGVAEPLGLRFGRQAGDIGRGDDEGDGHQPGDEAGGDEAE